MTALTYIAPTARRKMTKARAARIFLRENGICCICGVQIRPGEAYEIEHPDALALGGSDDDADLKPVHYRCHKIKSKRDAGQKAKRDRIVTAGFKGKPKSRGLRKPPGTVHVWGKGYVRISQDDDAKAQSSVEGKIR